MKTKTKDLIRSSGLLLAAGVGLGVAGYAASVGSTWLAYGHACRRTRGEESDALLDEFMPDYEVLERHMIPVCAPADVAYTAACELNVSHMAIPRLVFQMRSVFLHSKRAEPPIFPHLVDQAKAWGWGILAAQPGREIVFGGITRPWLPDPAFRAVPEDQFRSFNESGFVKIVWALRADALDAGKSLLRTETRVTSTDATARRKFRKYWSFVMPGSDLIRRMMLCAAKQEAERRVQNGGYSSAAAAA